MKTHKNSKGCIQVLKIILHGDKAEDELQYLLNGLLTTLLHNNISLLTVSQGENMLTGYNNMKYNKCNIPCPCLYLDAELQALTSGQGETQKTRKAPTCKTCGAPRKGHKKGTCEPTQN